MYPSIRNFWLYAGLTTSFLIRSPIVHADDFGAKTSGNWNSASTWTASGVPSLNDNVYIGSTFPNGAAATASVILTQNQQANTVQLGYGFGTSGTLDLGNFKLTAFELGFGAGGNAAISRGTGFVDVNTLRLFNTSLLMNGNDKTQNLYLFEGATATTAATGNVTKNVQIENSSTLSLGADLLVTGFVDVTGNDSTLNAQGYKITAPILYLGQLGGTNVQLLNAELAVTTLNVSNRNLNLVAADAVTNFNLYGASTTLGSAAVVQNLSLDQYQDGEFSFNSSLATTTAAGNITRSVQVLYGSVLTLGADLSVTESVSVVGNNTTLNAQKHRITTLSLTLHGNAQFLNDGAVTVNSGMGLTGGAQIVLNDGNDTAHSLLLSDSGLTIKSAPTGFTISGTSAAELQFYGTSTLTLELDGTQPGWALRWANPASGDHIADLNALIGENSIVFSATNGGQYNLVSQDGYTYIFQPVPEPSLLLLFAAPVAVGHRLRRWRLKNVRANHFA